MDDSKKSELDPWRNREQINF